MAGSNRIKLRRIRNGDIALLEWMGSDATIASAARVSHIGAQYDGPERTNERDVALIRYLYSEKHTSPFEHVRFRFRVECPIFVARQWMRHRTGSFNELSARYAELSSECFIPMEYRAQSTKDKQSSAGLLPDRVAENVHDEIEQAYQRAFDAYQYCLNVGLSRELARTVLPVGAYTSFVWSVDLHNLMHFLDLRLSEHAQPEIQLYARNIIHLIRPIVPIAMECFESRGDGSGKIITST